MTAKGGRAEPFIVDHAFIDPAYTFKGGEPALECQHVHKSEHGERICHWKREDHVDPGPAAQPSESEREGARWECHCTGVWANGLYQPHEDHCKPRKVAAPPSPPSTGQSREPLAEVLRETVEGLQFYGRHLSTCAMKQRASFVTGHEEPPCTCGLEACVVAARRALESKP
jgi:hypothetical protein